jgi:hypothetical protein
MSDIRFPCSGCGVTLKVTNPALAGKKLKCPKCAALTVIPAPAPDGDAPAQPVAKPTSPVAARPKAAAPAPSPVKAAKPVAIKSKPKPPPESIPEESDEEPRGNGKTPKVKKGMDVIGIVVAIIVVAYLGALAAAYFGYLGYQPGG